MGSRFDGLAERYQRYRPRYPKPALDRIAQACHELSDSNPVLLDVGAGTGISSRALARALGGAWRIVGIEPSADMRETAIRDSVELGHVEFVDGTAEALPSRDGDTSAVTVAQALHWFDRPAFYREVGRVLSPAGILVVLFNDRDGAAPIFQAFEDLMERQVPGYSRGYRQFDYEAEIRALGWTSGVDAIDFTWCWRLSLADFAGLMLSRSYAKPWLHRDGEQAASRHLQAFAQDYAESDMLSLPYITRLVIVKKR